MAHGIEIESDSTWDSTTSNTSLHDEWIYPHPTDFKLTEAPIDEIRKLHVAVIGAGISGINAGILLPMKVPGIQLTILDKNHDVVKCSWAAYHGPSALTVVIGWHLVSSSKIFDVFLSLVCRGLTCTHC